MMDPIKKGAGHPKLGRRRLIVGLALGFVLLGGTQAVPRQVEHLINHWPILRLWPDAGAQLRLQVGADLYDALVAADTRLPRSAAVVLVTPGVDPRRNDYIAFHRALYHLAPRPVWWANPAPPDGTWEARWWIETPIASAPIETLATSKGAQYVLFYQVDAPPGLGRPVELTPNARVVALGEAPLEIPEPTTTPTSPQPWRLTGLIAGLLAILAAGYAVVGLAARLGYASGRIESVALAWALGAGVVSLAMLWLNALGLPLATQLPVIAAGTVLAALVVGIPQLRAFRYLKDRGQDSPYPTYRPQEGSGVGATLGRAALALLIAVEIGYGGLLAVGQSLAIWDSWVTWAMKARIIFLDGRISPVVFGDPSRTVTHLDYPLLVPLLEAWTFAWALPSGTSTQVDDRLAGIQAVLFFAALLGACYGILRRLGAGRTLTLAGVAAIGSIAPLGGLATLVFADVPLAVYATLAGGYLAVWLRTKAPGALLIAALAGGLLPWTKREGIVLLAALCLAVLLLNRGRPAARHALVAFGGAALLLAGPWWAFVAWQGIPNTDFLPLTWESFQANADRLPVIARMVLASLLSPEWSYLWPALALCGLLVGSRRPTRRATDLWPIAALVYLGLMSLGYVFSAFVPFEQHVASSIDRLIAQVVALPVLWITARGIDES